MENGGPRRNKVMQNQKPEDSPPPPPDETPPKPPVREPPDRAPRSAVAIAVHRLGVQAVAQALAVAE